MNQHTDPRAVTRAAPALQALRNAADAAVRAVPPVWPLATSVAVNPFVGQAGMGLAATATLMGRVAGTAILPERPRFAKKIAAGEVTRPDLEAALARLPEAAGLCADDLIAAASAPRPAPQALPTLVDLAAADSGIDVPALVVDRIGATAAGYFDQGQAIWSVAAPSLYAAWREAVQVDPTPAIAGLPALRDALRDAPATAEAALHAATGALGLEADALPLYFHRLLMSVGGWAQYARGQLFMAEQQGRADSAATDLLAIRLTWEAATLAALPDLADKWAEARTAYAAPPAPARDDVIDAALQEAADIAAQRRLAERLAAAPAPAAAADRPALQAAFCIDVRSEVFRRALEAQADGIETIGFAGFFGLSIAHTPFAAERTEARCPVLLTPGVTTKAAGGEQQVAAARRAARAGTAWSRFKQAAVSCFGFVEAVGPTYLPQLVRDSLGHGAGCSRDHEHAPAFDPALTAEQQVDTAEALLRAMSLTRGFAPVVILAGHGARVVNNPHAAALDCGACGGHSGEANARLLAGLLNAPAVREGLAQRGIDVPADTTFVAALHDTTTDAVTLYDAPDTPAVAQARAWLSAAGAATRAERAQRLPGATSGALPDRATDWAQVRPEWALAGCAAFVAAPRAMTAGRDLAGRAFLHSYDWRADAAQGYGTLELILTAPVVVASWISLQYFGSTTAPEAFGGGNKLLHNVVGGIGVLEGNGGDLRPGLPWQSVHDGDGFVHDPLRLTVAVAAPTEAIGAVLDRHPDVAALFDNGWLALFALDDAGRMTARYAGGLAWEEVAAPAAAAA